MSENEHKAFPAWVCLGGDRDAEGRTVADEAELEAAAKEGYYPVGGAPAKSEGGPLDELLAGTIPSITKALGDLSLEQLADLHAAETAGKGRAGVLAGIDAERAKRAE